MKKRRSKQLSVGRILAMKPDKLDKLSTKRLKELTTYLNSAANKRVKRAQQLGTESEILRQAIEGGRFKTSRVAKGTTEAKAREIAIAEFMRVREFMKKETSSTRGVKKTQKKILKKFKSKAKKKFGIDTENVGIIPEDTDPFKLGIEGFTEQDLNDLVWTQVDKLAETKALTKENRYQAAGEAYEILSKEIKSKDELHELLVDWSNRSYIEDVEKSEEDVPDEEIDKIFKRLFE